MKSIGIYICDKDIFRQRGLASILSKDPLNTIIGCEGSLFYEVRNNEIPAREIDVLLINLDDYPSNMIEWWVFFKIVAPHASILGLTLVNEPDTTLLLLAVGASAIFIPNATPSEIRSAVRSTARGRAYYSKTILNYMKSRLMRDLKDRTQDKLTKIDTLNHGAWVGGQKVNFTNREWQVCSLLKLAKTNREIAHRLSISIKTVEYHIGNILRKSSMASRTQIIAAIEK